MYMSCTTGDHLKYSIVLALMLLLARVLSIRLISYTTKIIYNHLCSKGMLRRKSERAERVKVKILT